MRDRRIEMQTPGEGQAEIYEGLAEQEMVVTRAEP
jgi:hypothetical protein